MKLLIEKAFVLTMTDAETGIRQIGIEDDTILFIGPPPEDFSPDKVIDGTDCLVMPGLVNAHTHSAMSLLRNYADDIPFWEWLTKKVWPIEERMSADDVYWGSMLSIAEMIRSGITSFADMYFQSEATARAAADSGIRCSIAKGLVGTSDEDNKRFSDTRRLVSDWHQTHDGRITVMAGPHAPYTCDDIFIGKVLDLCAELNLPVHIHLSESKNEVNESIEKYGHSPIQHMNTLGVFNHHTLAAHCVHLMPDDYAILQANNVHVVHNPASNLKLGNGIAPLSKMLQAGIGVSIGTDGSSSNNNLNLFEEMNLASLLAKGISEDPSVVPAYDVLRMGTINGAKALNIDSSVGTLEAGKKADLILIDLNKPHFYPRYNLVSSLIYSAQASDVKTVIINGRIVMEDRVFTTIDTEKTYDHIKIICDRLLTD
jgi:5-methylthioadenosine/S-adenosylhomocysteine deaminase